MMMIMVMSKLVQPTRKGIKMRSRVTSIKMMQPSLRFVQRFLRGLSPGINQPTTNKHILGSLSTTNDYVVVQRLLTVHLQLLCIAVNHRNSQIRSRLSELGLNSSTLHKKSQLIQTSERVHQE